MGVPRAALPCFRFAVSTLQPRRRGASLTCIPRTHRRAVTSRSLAAARAAAGVLARTACAYSHCRHGRRRRPGQAVVHTHSTGILVRRARRAEKRRKSARRKTRRERRLRPVEQRAGAQRLGVAHVLSFCIFFPPYVFPEARRTHDWVLSLLEAGDFLWPRICDGTPAGHSASRISIVTKG